MIGDIITIDYGYDVLKILEIYETDEEAQMYKGAEERGVFTWNYTMGMNIYYSLDVIQDKGFQFISRGTLEKDENM